MSGAMVTVLQSRQFSRLQNAFKYSVSGASKLVATKTPLLKHSRLTTAQNY